MQSKSQPLSFLTLLFSNELASFSFSGEQLARELLPVKYIRQRRYPRASSLDARLRRADFAHAHSQQGTIANVGNEGRAEKARKDDRGYPHAKDRAFPDWQRLPDNAYTVAANILPNPWHDNWDRSRAARFHAPTSDDDSGDSDKKRLHPQQERPHAAFHPISSSPPGPMKGDT